ncbi:hypothetical protein [Streptomyces sp. NPDC002889]|uniref:hypothetical protein n=1 Tax=Streptomyces sp. NPDC002889 TaxID=3364669 RepID=UPI00368F4A3C
MGTLIELLDHDPDDDVRAAAISSLAIFERADDESTREAAAALDRYGLARCRPSLAVTPRCAAAHRTPGRPERRIWHWTTTRLRPSWPN